MKLIRYAIILLLFVTVAMTLITYPRLPDAVASHWNAAGNVDDYLPKS
jgi:uncharacterized membrane protein